MSANSSSSSNDSLHHPNLSSIDSYLPYGLHCLITRPGSLVYTMFSITNILLLLPLCIFILYLGLQQWRQQCSTSTAAAMMSHSDSFTYHMVTMELFGVLGHIILCCGIYRKQVNLILAGFFLCSIPWFGEILFHILTCVERYLAVVHPIIYLSLRRERGIRIRNISIGCAWLFCFGATSLMILENVSLIFDCCLLIFSLIIISFCSLSVVCVLIRPGPGEQARDRERVDQSKLRAFYTIITILGVLFVRFVSNLIWSVLYVMNGNADCLVMISAPWANLPCSLVLPLLFVHRAGTLASCKNSTK